MAQQVITKKLNSIFYALAALSLTTPALALPNSLGSAGIDALKLQAAPYNLTGRKIAIGQVEIGRPGYFGLDKTASPNLWLSLARVFYRDAPAKSNSEVDGHASMVAGVMISNDKAIPGVSPKALLYSSAVGSPKTSGQAEECLATQYVAQQNGGDLRAINFSFGEPLDTDTKRKAVLDGNSLLTQCVDWSARIHDVLYAVAGNQGKGGIPIPTDNFNAVNVAYTTRRDSLFTKVDFPNLSDTPIGVARPLLDREINVGGRRSISLVAPGANLNLYDLKGKVTRVSGTSFAAPHVTGSVALLQEFADLQLKSRQPRWSTDARRHEVMKAVLLNSAEKIKDAGDGLRLGMSRTILAKNNSNWLDSDAYKDPKIPLHYQMGAGQLNVFRAYQQFSSGKWSATSPMVDNKGVAPIAWDYSSLKASNYQDYVLEQPLQQGSFVSITLAWDRKVELKDTNKNGQYDIGEGFSDRGLNNLDIYLMRAEDNDTSKSIWSSQSDVDSVEHIFHEIPANGRYKIRVQFRQQVNDDTQPYALAWWSVPVKNK
ncbi:MAG TPA: S8 family serine peptidase [Oculatellaceae cyanobacterium]